MVAEPAVAESWLFGQLDPVFSIPVYVDAGPEDAVYPFVVFAHLDSVDHNTADGTRVWSRMDYLVRVADRAESLLTLMAGAALIDATIHKDDGVPAAGGRVLSCVREEPFRQREVVDGVVHLSLGGVYRLLVGG